METGTLTRKQNAASTRLSLPWLELRLETDTVETRSQLEWALFKLAAGGTAGVPCLEARFKQAAEPEARQRAAAVWERGTLKYQFVRGEAEAVGARFATADGSLLELDLERGVLRGQVYRETFTAPYSTWADLVLAPLTEFWRHHGCYPLHAGAVELGEHRFLVPGFSGSGKTTFCLAALAAGGIWRADDKLLFRTNEPGPRAISLYRNTNLHPETVRHYVRLAFTLDRDPIDETNPKRPCLLEELPVPVDLSEFVPTAVLFPGVSGAAETAISRLSPPEAHVRLAAQSPLSAYPPRIREQVRAVAALARHLPAFQLAGGRDLLEEPAAAAERVRDAVQQALRS